MGATMVNVKQFGAVGDGQTDDRPAIQAAMNYARQQSGATVYFEPGVYLLATSTSPAGQLTEPEWNFNLAYSMNCDRQWRHSPQQRGRLGHSPGGGVLAEQHDSGQSRSRTRTFDDSHDRGHRLFRRRAQPDSELAYRRNTFKNFSRHIAISGVNTMDTTTTSFLMTNGRDSGTGANPEPTSESGCSTTDRTAAPSTSRFNAIIMTAAPAAMSRTPQPPLRRWRRVRPGQQRRVNDNYFKGFSFEGVYCTTTIERSGTGDSEQPYRRVDREGRHQRRRPMGHPLRRRQYHHSP